MTIRPGGRALAEPSPSRRRRSYWPYLFLAPFLILFTVFLLYPIVNTVLISFQNKEGLGAGTFVGLDNYVRLLRDPRFFTAVRNSVVLTVASLCILVPSALGLAIGMNSRRLAGKRWFRLVFFLPAASSAVIAAMIGYVFFDQKYGFVNTQLGIDVPWLTSAALILPTIFILIYWKWVGYSALYFLAGLQTIETEIVDAASVDGANARQLVRYIYVPMLKPIIMVVVVLVILSSVQVFAEPFLLTRGTGGPGQGGLTVAMMMWDTAFRQLRLGYGAAIGMFTVLGAVAASIVAVRLLRGDEP